MKRDAFYFKHDSNARNDEKIIALRMTHGMAGYGVFWSILEKLRESTGYTLPTNYELIAFELHTDKAIIKSVVEDFGLFKIKGDKFWSNRLMGDLEQWIDIKAKRSAAGKASAESRAKAKAQRLEEEGKKSVRFVKPTRDEVAQYCKERANNVNPEKWYDYYESQGWKVGKNPMKDWKAAVRTWEKNNYGNGTRKEQIAGADEFVERT